MPAFNVSVYLDDMYVKSIRVTAFDELDAREAVENGLYIDFDVEEAE